jgi:hypothetical protein
VRVQVSHPYSTTGKITVFVYFSTTPWRRIGEWSASLPGSFTPRERAPGIHWIGGWVGPRASLDTAVVKRRIPSPYRDSNLLPSSP